MDSIHSFLAGGGEMGARIRGLDWAGTPLGPLERWPQSLRSAVSILLPSKAQIAMFWGEDLITLYNDAYRPVFGAKHPAALGKPIREAWDELWRAGLKELFDGVLSTGEAFWAKDRPFFMERHGYLEETYFDVSYDPIRDESGRVGGVFCIVSEVTGRVVGERRLKTLRDLGEHAAQARSVTAVYRTAADVLRQNGEDIPFALLYGAAAAGAPVTLMASTGADASRIPELPCLQENVQRLLDVNDLACFGPLRAGPWPEPISQALFVPLAEPGEAPQGGLVAGISPRRRMDDDYRDFLRLVASNIAAGVASARRSEDEHRRAEMLAELDRAKTAFFSNVSHEFRTPLTLMLGPVDDALADAAQPLEGAQRERLELARRSALRLQKLVNTLLDFSRIEAGRARASYVPTDLAAFSAELASSFRSAIEKAGLSFNVDCAPLGEPAYVDRDMWEKIVLNLLSNALKFTFEGEIAVSLRRAGAEIELAVRDTGIGIPADELAHVFERFRRVEGARSRTHEGTGIGLALVQELARLHGGSARVESVLGGGTTFTISIPAGKAHLPAEHIGARPELASTTIGAHPYVEEALRWLPETAPPTPRDCGPGDPALLRDPAGRLRARILLADDNADMRDYVRRLLQPYYDVEAVADGAAALEAIRSRAPELVLADVMMPRLDGLALVRALRAEPAIRDVPVVLLSARAGEEARIEGLDAGADDYIEKPFTAKELLARIGARREISALRRAAEADARERMRQLRFMTDHLPVMILHCDQDARFRFVNAPYSARFGLRPEEVQGKRIEEVLGPVAYESIRCHVEAALAGQRTEFEAKIPYQQHGERWMHCVYVPQVESDGRVSGFIAVLHDVSDRKRAEEALREQAETLEKLNAIGAALASQRDLQRLVQAVTDAATELSGARFGAFFYNVTNEAGESYTLYTLSGAPREAFERFGLPRNTAIFGPTFAGEGPVRLADVTADPRYGHNAPHRGMPKGHLPVRSYLAVPVVSGQGEVIGGLFFGHPECGVFTERAERIVTGIAAQAAIAIENARLHEQRLGLIRELREADSRKDEFIAMLSHELRNPLAPLRNSLQLLRMPGGSDPAPLHEMMERQVHHLVRLVDDLLEMSRVNRGTFELRKERVELAGVIRNALETSEPLIREAGHRLEVALPPEPLWLEGDPVRLAQILGNLLNNAARYTDRGGNIWVRAEQRNGWVAVSVRDSGAGFEPDHAARMFEMFNRGARSTGLGIGLALGRRLAEMHGGTIEGVSPGPGQGAEFIVRLPLAADQRAQAAATPPAAAPLAQRKVLVVDDNHDGAESLKLLLELLGAEVQVAHDGVQALQAFEASEPSLVLLDIGMPEMDGYEVARAIRSRFPASRAILVALTGWGQEDDRRRGREAGFDHHLVKPADLAALQGLLASVGEE